MGGSINIRKRITLKRWLTMVDTKDGGNGNITNGRLRQTDMGYIPSDSSSTLRISLEKTVRKM